MDLKTRIRKSLLAVHRFIFARPQLRVFNMFLVHLGFKGLGILQYESIKASGEQNFINNILPGLIHRENPVFFDVGANTGGYSRRLSQRFPNARIYAFEPHPKTFAVLMDGFGFSNLKCFNIGLGEQKGSFILYNRVDHQGSEHASLYKEVISGIHKKDVSSTQVMVETIEDIVLAQGIDRIDFLKIDCEGSELSILKGASSLIEQDAIGCVHFEFNEMNVVSRCFVRDFLHPEGNVRL